MSLHALRGRFVDSPDSLAERFRSRRWAMLSAAFPDLPNMRVLDLGGTSEAWLRAPIRPAHVHVVNLDADGGESSDWLTLSQADACSLPAAVRASRYDLVFSNAVIEHVGGHERRRRFADAVHSMASRHWVQTPYRYFPIEPHWLCPCLQHLPVAARTVVAQHWPLAHTRPTDRGDALSAVLQVELLSRTEMRYYFPDSHIVCERIGPITKSLIAVRGASGGERGWRRARPVAP